VPGKPGPPVIGPVTIRDRACYGLDPLGTGGALGDHQRPDRLDLAVPPFRPAACPAGLRRAGGADGIQQVGLALTAPVLPVGAVGLNNPDADSGNVEGQAGNSSTPSSPPMASGAAMARTRWPPGPVHLGQARPGSQAGSADGCPKTWVRPTDRFSGQPERRQPIRRSGRPRPSTMPCAKSKPGRQGRRPIHILPADSALRVGIEVCRARAVCESVNSRGDRVRSCPGRVRGGSCRRPRHPAFCAGWV